MVSSIYLTYVCTLTPYSGCPVGYTCQPDIGDNPDSGYLSYDNLGWALIAIDQIFTLDNMDDLYDKV
jgi:hypothetical protein